MKSFLVLVLLVFLACEAFAFPSLLPVQGKLRGNTASDVNASMPFTFSLYSAVSGGTALWTVTKTVDINIADSDNNIGVFSVLLGENGLLDINSHSDFNFLGIEIQSNGEMVPRVRLGSSAYAFYARHSLGSDLLDGRDWSSAGDVNATAVQASGFFGDGSGLSGLSVSGGATDTTLDNNAAAQVYYWSNLDGNAQSICDANQVLNGSGDCIDISNFWIDTKGSGGPDSTLDTNAVADANWLGNNHIFTGKNSFNNDLNGSSVSATMYFGDGSQLTGITVSGGTTDTTLDNNVTAQKKFWDYLDGLFPIGDSNVLDINTVIDIRAKAQDTNAASICDANQVLNGSGVCIDITNFWQDTTGSAIVDTTIDTNAVAQKWFFDTLISWLPIGDVNLAFYVPNEADIDNNAMEWDTNAMTACDNNTVLTGGGDCIEISNFYIDTVGSGSTDTTLDSNATAEASWLAKTHSFTADTNFSSTSATAYFGNLYGAILNITGDANFVRVETNDLYSVNLSATGDTNVESFTASMLFGNGSQLTGIVAGSNSVDSTVDNNLLAQAYYWSNLASQFPVPDANVADDITLTNITQITNRAYVDLTGQPYIPTEQDIDLNAKAQDTNIFTSGVADCGTGQYLYGFNSNGTIDCRADQGGGGTRTYTGIAPVLLDNDINTIGLVADFNNQYSALTDVNNASRLTYTIIADAPWAIGYIPTKADFDANIWALDTNAQTACDGNFVPTGAGSCIDITSFWEDTTGGNTILSLPWADANVADDITLTNLTQVTTRNYSDLQNILQDTTLDSNATASNSWLGKTHSFTADQNFSNIGFSGLIFGNGSQLTGINISNESVDSTLDNNITAQNYYWSNLDGNAQSICDGNTALTGNGDCIDLTNFYLDADTTTTDTTLDTNAVADANWLGNNHIFTGKNTFNSDLNASSVTATMYFGDGSQLTGITATGGATDTTLDNNTTAQAYYWSNLASQFPVPDANVADNITLTNLTQVTIRNYSDLQNILQDTTLDSNVTASNSWVGKPHTFSADTNFSSTSATAYFGNLYGAILNITGDANFVRVETNDLYTTNISSTGDVNANSVSATQYFGDGSQLTGITVSGGTTDTTLDNNITAQAYYWSNLASLFPVPDANVADNITVNWTGLDTYPSACSAGQFVTSVGDTLTCSLPSYTLDTTLDNNVTAQNYYWSNLAGLFPVTDANVDNGITLTNLTQITTRNYSDLQNILQDTTLDSNSTASTSYLGTAHTWTANQTIQADLNVTQSGTSNGASIEPDLNRFRIGQGCIDGNGTAIVIFGGC